MMGKPHSSFGRRRTADPSSAVTGERTRSKSRHEEGQALVEFALVIPLILLLILGVVDFGRAYNYKNDITSLANQAARFAEVNACSPCSGQSIEAYIKAQADSSELQNGSSGSFGIVPPGATISFCFPAGSTGQVGDSLMAKAAASYNWLPYLHLAPITIQSTVTVRIATAYTSPPSGNAYSKSTTPPAC